MIPIKMRWLIVGICLLFVGALSALAQETDEVINRGSDELVSQMDAFRKGPDRIPVEEEEAPEIEVEEEKPPAKPEGPRFTLKQIRWEGNQVFSDKTLSVYAQPFEGKEVSFSEIQKMTQLVTNHYRSQGYVISRAYIPPQRVEDRTVTIQIIEGKIGSIFVEGNEFFKSKLYKDAIHLAKLDVFRYQDLEESLFYLNQKPDRKAKAYLIPGLEPQTSDIILKAKEELPFHLKYEFHTRGTKFTHRPRHVISATHNNPFGMGDSLTTSLSIAEEGAFVGGSYLYTFPIEKTLTTLSISQGHARSRLVKKFKGLEIEGKSFSLTPRVTQTVARSMRFKADMDLSFEIKDSKTSVNNLKLSHDRMRVVRVGPRMSYRDKWGRTLLNGDFRVGIPNILNGLKKIDDRASKKNAGGEFTAYNASLVRIQNLPFQSLLILRGVTQWTWDTLASLEQFRGGGAFSVRGYPESEATGDYGYNWSAEIRVPPPFVSRYWKIPFTKRTWRNSIRFLGFIEGAKTFNHQRALPSTVKDHFLLGTGFGLQVDLGKSLQLELGWGFPIGDDSSDRKDSGQIHLSIRAGV